MCEAVRVTGRRLELHARLPHCPLELGEARSGKLHVRWSRRRRNCRVSLTEPCAHIPIARCSEAVFHGSSIAQQRIGFIVTARALRHKLFLLSTLEGVGGCTEGSLINSLVNLQARGSELPADVRREGHDPL